IARSLRSRLRVLFSRWSAARLVTAARVLDKGVELRDRGLCRRPGSGELELPAAEVNAVVHLDREAILLVNEPMRPFDRRRIVEAHHKFSHAVIAVVFSVR